MFPKVAPPGPSDGDILGVDFMAASRKQQIEGMLAESPNDSFLLYALAMEYLKEGDTDEGIARLATLTQKDPDYQAAYFQLGQVLVEEGKPDEAKTWITDGIAAAKRIGDTHAATEMQGFLDML